jgi:hypothetical protein
MKNTTLQQSAKKRGNRPEPDLPKVIELPENPLYRPKIRKCEGITNSDVYRLSATIIRDRLPDVVVNLQTGVQIRPNFDKLALMSFINLAGIIKTEPGNKIVTEHLDPDAVDQYGRTVAKMFIIYKKCVENPKT